MVEKIFILALLSRGLEHCISSCIGGFCSFFGRQGIFIEKIDQNLKAGRKTST